MFVSGEEVILRKLRPFKEASPDDAIFRLIGKDSGPIDLAENRD